MERLAEDATPIDARPPHELLSATDDEFGRLMEVHDGEAEAPPGLFDRAAAAPAGVPPGGVRFESEDQARARGSAARDNALAATVAGCTASARVLSLRQKAVAYELVVSCGEPTVTLAQRHLDLGLQYLEMGWPAAALGQAEKAREVNKQLLAAEDLQDDKVSRTEELHPYLLLLNAKANLCLGQIKRARSSHKRAHDMADILYSQTGNNVVWCELAVVEAYALAAEGDVDAGFDAVFKALETAESLQALAQGDRLRKVGEMFTHASKLCLLENDEEEALEYAIKAFRILKENMSARSRLCADAALRAATIAAMVGKNDVAAPLFSDFFDCSWYAADSLASVAASRWHRSRDKDGLTVLARLVLGRRGGERAAAGGESLATFFAAIDAPGLTRTWGKTAVLTALRVRAAEGMMMKSDENGAPGGTRTKPDQWSYERLAEAESKQPRREPSSSSSSSSRPAWGSGVGSAVTVRKTPRKSGKPAKRPSSGQRKRRGSNSSARSDSGTEGEESESLPASAPDTPPPTTSPPNLSLPRLDLPDKEERDKLFRSMDYNGNGTLSLAEIDKAVLEMWPHFNHQPALMRAYKAADVSKDGWVGRKEFRLLLEYLVYFNNLWDKFDEIDASGDRRLSLDEFITGCGVIGENLSGSEAEAEFAVVDSNDGGYVLFDEFCAWCARRQIVDDADEPVAEPKPEPAWEPEPEPVVEPEPEHKTWLDSDSGSSAPDLALDGEADSKKLREARRARYQAEENCAATPAAAVARDAASRRSLPQGKPTHWRKAATAGQKSPGRKSRERPQTAGAVRRSAPSRSKSVQRAGSTGRQRVKVAHGTGKKLGADLEAANLEVLDQASFANLTSGMAKDRHEKLAEQDSKKARLARLDKMARPGTAPANKSPAVRKSGGAPSMMGPKKKREFGKETKELDAKLRASKLKNLLRRIQEESASGPNYHGTTKINPLDFYEFGEEIGKGAFGKVRVATHLLTGAQVAVKTYEKHIIRKFESRRADVGETIANTPDGGDGSRGKKRTGNLNDRKPFCVEAEILVRLNHTNCVELYQTIDSAQRIHVVIEFVDGGTLDQYCKQFQDRKLAEPEAGRVFAPIASALEYVHSRSICHRDVKLDNVLLYKHTQEVRLADYGLGEFTEKGKKLKLLCGTPAYVAPEIVENKQYSGTAVDVWSLGVLLFITVTGHSPYKGKTHNDMLRAIMRARLPTGAPGWGELSTQLQDLISVMLQGNPKLRATMKEVLAHPWVQSGAADAAARHAAPGSQKGGSAPPVGVGISESEVDREALAELEGFGFERDTVLAALAAGKRNSLTATYRLALHQRYLRERDSASASGMFASVRKSREAEAAESSDGWEEADPEDLMGVDSSAPLSVQDVP